MDLGSVGRTHPSCSPGRDLSMATFSFTQNLGHITDYGLTFFPERPALLQDGMSLTYRELDERINRVAQGLLARGLRLQDRVLILWEGDIRFVEVVLGVIRAGGIAVPVNSQLSMEKHRELLDDAGTRYVLASAVTAATAVAFHVEGLVGFAAGVGSQHDGVPDYEEWLADQADERPDIRLDVDAVAWQPYTSGSTGVPKGVLISHRMLLRNAQQVSSAMFIEPSDRVIVSTPLFHMNASAVGLLPCLAAGASAYVLPGFDAKSVLAGIEEQKCTYITGVPAMYKMLLGEEEQIARRDLSSLRMILCGSAPMPPALLDELKTVFPRATFSEGYGLTECGPVATLVPRMGVRKLGSIGMPFPDVEVRIVDDVGRALSSGQTGELWLRSKCTALGYHRRPEETAKRFKDGGWFATGDLVMADEDGWLYFRGRADDMMSVGGENVYPAEVEAVLAQHPKVRDVCVVSMPHEIKGEVPVSFVVLHEGCELDETELRDFFLERGPAFAHPRRITILPTMPLSGTGKVDRRELARRAVEPVQQDA